MRGNWQTTRAARRLSVEQLESRNLLSGSMLPDVTYHGGPLLQNVQVESVYYGQPWTTTPSLQTLQAQTDGFLQYFVTSPYMEALKQYNVGLGTFLNKDDFINQNPANNTIDDSTIRQVLDGEISAGHVVAPNTNQLYIFFTAPGVTVTANGQNSNTNFAGYHSVFNDTAGATVYYAVLPYPTGGVATVPLTDFQQTTVVLSHEIAEAATDPDTQTGWFDPTYGEICDIANGQVGTLNGYVVSGVWSQAAGQVIIPSASSPSSPGLQVNGDPVQAVAGQPFTSIVATLTGISTDAGLTASIDWGDGNTSAATLTADPNGGFDVTGTNTYGQTGTFAALVTIDDSSGAAVGSVLTTASVAAAAPTVAATGALLTATAGQSFSGAVATFTDSSPSAALGNYTTTINWGDGSTSTGTVAATTSGFVVDGTHTYAAAPPAGGAPFRDYGTYGSVVDASGNQHFVVTVTIDDTPTGSAVKALSLAKVVPPPAVITAKDENLTAVSGQSFTGVVATFTDTNSAAAAGDFTATITWGDGTTSTGTVAVSGSGFVVTGTHTYSTVHDWYGFHDGFNQDRQFVVGVSITDTETNDQAKTLGLATVLPKAANLLVAAQDLTATIGQSFSGVVATFTDSNASLGAADFTATIAWGDGSTSTGTIAADPQGGFDVTGTHTYTSANNQVWYWGGPRYDLDFGPEGGAFALSVTVKAKTDTDSGTSQSRAVVKQAAANVQATGVLLTAMFGQSFSGTVATFTTPTSSATGLAATIDWGDGTTSTGTIAASGSGFVVTGTHTYGGASDHDGGWWSPVYGSPNAGTRPFLITVTIDDATNGSTATAVSLAAVTAAPPNLVAHGLDLNPSKGNVFTGTVASFTDADGSGARSFTATISWGDGTTTSGTINANPSGAGFLVGGTHTYNAGGNYYLFVLIKDADGDRAISFGTAYVGDNTSLSALSVVADAFVQSTEYLTDLIVADYQQYLGRTPSGAEVAWWVNGLRQGTTDAQVQAAFLGSAEFYGRAGNNPKAWVDAMYQTLLGRSAEAAGEAYWLAALSGGAARSDVALGIATSREYEGDIVEGYYQKYLGRTAGSAEVNYWVSSFANGMTDEQIVASFLSSPGYFQLQHANAPDWLASAYQKLLSRSPDAGGLNFWLGVLGQ